MWDYNKMVKWYKEKTATAAPGCDADEVLVGAPQVIVDIKETGDATAIKCQGYAGKCNNGDLRLQADRTADNQCGSCDSGYELMGIICKGFGGVCENGTLLEQSKRTGDDQCGSCNSGYYIDETAQKAQAAGGTAPVKCIGYAGECQNGTLEAQDDRNQENDCGKCDPGYHLVNSACPGWAGTCEDGTLIEQTKRTKEDHCGSCNPGWRLVGTDCHAWGGACNNGKLRAQAKRTDSNQCGSCNPGYHLVGVSCPAWGGSCAHGDLAEQAKRTQENHCAVCQNGYRLVGDSPPKCPPWAGKCDDGELIAQTSRRQDNHCGTCNPGYYMKDLACPGYAGSCANGDLIEQSKRVQENHCGKCDAGWYLQSKKCVNWGGECKDGELRASALRSADNQCGTCNEGFELNGTDCQKCELGKFKAAKGTEKCVACAAGKSAGSTGQSACDQCAAGKISGVGERKCDKCGRNGQEPNDAQTECLTCPVGKAAMNGDAQCVTCAAGTIAAKTGSADCKKCQPGTVQGEAGKTLCVDCDAGQFARSAGSSACAKCAAGQIAAAKQASECDACAEGQISAEAGNTECTKCAPGQFAGKQGESACTKCAAGSISAEAGAKACTECAAGKVQTPASGERRRLQAADVKYNAFNSYFRDSWCKRLGCDDESGPCRLIQWRGSARSFLAGQHSKEVQDASKQKRWWAFEMVGSKQARLFSARYGEIDGKQYVGGPAKTDPGLKEWTPTTKESEGYVEFKCTRDTAKASITGDWDCPNWQPGAAGPIKVDKITMSRFGLGYMPEPFPWKGYKTVFEDGRGWTHWDLNCRYSNQVLANEYAAEEGEEEDDSDGSSMAIAPSSFENSCTACAAGKFTRRAGGIVCQNCKEGKFAAAAEATECDKCAAGTFTAKDGKSVCDACAAGTITTLPGKSECEDCGKGKFASETGKSECVDCPQGQAQKGEGKTECVACVAGMFAKNKGTVKCRDCEPGSFAAAAGAPLCDGCAAGKVQRKSGATVCVDCALGQFIATGGGTRCGVCNRGTIAAGAGATKCTACEAGSAQGKRGQFECPVCEVGTIAAAAGASRCTWCQPGTFQAATGQTACTACEAGSWAGRKKEVACKTWTECAAGSFVTVEPSASVDRECKLCARQTWSGEKNAKECAWWTTCAGPEGETVETGVAVPGTSTTDVECSKCLAGEVSLVADSLSTCFDSNDLDKDGLPDRFGYKDRRAVGVDKASRARSAYNPLEDMDTRPAPTSGGGAYDTCPFDPMNDEDGDGICAQATPAAYRRRIGANKELFAAGGHRQDMCPQDADNDADKDGICGDCSKQRYKGCDKLVTTFDFYSHNLVGWRDSKCWPKDGKECPQPEEFIKPMPLKGKISPIDANSFGFDALMTEECKMTDTEATGIFVTPQSCDDMCARHHMVCEAAAVIEAVEEVAKEALIQDKLEDMRAAAKAESRRLLAAQRGDKVDLSDPGDEGAAEKEQAMFCKAKVTKDQCGARSAGAGEQTLKCQCTFDEDYVKTEEWSQDKLCPTCYASTSHDVSLQGAMSTQFTIKKNTMRFMLAGASGATRFVRLTVLDTTKVGKKGLVGQPTVLEVVSNRDEGAWYPVEWDLSKMLGEVAVLEVADFDPAGAISVDEFQMYNDKQGCLPSCMKIEDGICDGETCFYFEGDQVPYVKLKSKGPTGGLFCRQVEAGQEGAPLGPEISKMGSKGKNGFVAATLDFLAAGSLPRCVVLDMKGSHYAISTADVTLGEDEPKQAFAYADFSDRMGVTGAYCVYPSLKPRCVSWSKPRAAFKPMKAANCKAEFYETTCFDQCYSIHCPADADRACGGSKAFQDCANCCGSNHNLASGCFRRRRRLRDATTALAAGAKGRNDFSANECAEKCLDKSGCIAFYLESGACALTAECDKTKGGAQGFISGTWNVWRTLQKSDLTSKVIKPVDPDAPPVKKKRRRKKSAPAPAPAAELAE